MSGTDDILMRDRDGSHPRNITNDPPADGWPTWTPDGKHIVYASRRGRAFVLYVMDSDAWHGRPVTNPPDPDFDGRPNVSSDGKKIVFTRERGETIGIFVVELRECRAGAPTCPALNCRGESTGGATGPSLNSRCCCSRSGWPYSSFLCWKCT